jgi:hypothetical protein
VNDFQQLMRQWTALATYNAGHVMRVSGTPDLERWRAALSVVLRTLGITEPVLIESSTLELDQKIMEELNRPFVPGTLPLRAFVIVDQRDSHLLGVIYDHWFADSPSLRALMQRVFVHYSGSGENLQANNLTQELKDAGLAAPTPFTKVYDLTGAFGGPIKKDRVWYFVNARTQGSTRVTANQFYNLNAGDPTKYLYAPDFSRPGFSDRTWENVSGRVTWQVTPRNKIGGFWDEQWVCRKCDGNTIGITTPAVVSPEANGPNQTLPLRVPQVTWSSPLTNRLLLEAGFGGT